MHSLDMANMTEIFKQFKNGEILFYSGRKSQTRREAGTESHGSSAEDSRVASITYGGMIMKKFLSILLVVAALVSISSMASAYSSWTIADNYIGADPTHNSWDGKDVVGDNNLFGVDRMEIKLEDKLLTIDIYSYYFDNIGKYETSLGDLFISNDGWNPYGDAPYVNDNSTNGEDWEYAFHINRDAQGNLTGALYDIQNAQDHIVLSSAPSGYIYRVGQEVLVNTNGLNSVASGNVNIVDVPNSGLDYLSISFDISALHMKPGDLMGLHWGMSCGNDVIEGAFDPGIVPEPSTVFLIGIGLLGVLGIGRKRMKK